MKRLLVIVAVLSVSLGLAAVSADPHDEVYVEDLPDSDVPDPPRSTKSIFDQILLEDQKVKFSRSQCHVIKKELSHPALTGNPISIFSTAVKKNAPCPNQPLSTSQVIESDPLVVSTLDGALHAVSPDTGEILWTTKNDPVLKIPTETKNHAVNMLPNPKDGSLYVINNLPGASESIRKLPFTIPELVSASPTRSSDGVLYMGKKTDRWMALDARTGLRVDIPAASDILEETCPWELNNRVLIGRSEYTISMVDSKKRGSCAHWNVTFHDYAAMDLPDGEAYNLFHFVSSSNGRLLSVERSSGAVLHEKFFGDHPIVAVYSLRQDGLFRVPFTTVAPETLENLENSASDFARTKSDLFPTLYVGQWSEGLYAVPSFVDDSIVTIQRLPEAALPPLLEGPSNQPQVASGSPDDAEFLLAAPKPEAIVLFGYYEVKEPLLIGQKPDPVPIFAEKPWTEEEDLWKKRKIVNKTEGAPVQPTEAPPVVHEANTEHQFPVKLVVIICVVVTVVSTVLAVAATFVLGRYSAGWDVSRQSSRSMALDAFDPRIIPEDEERLETGEVKVDKIVYHPEKILGYGCKGTFVYAGKFDGREVAVKRLLTHCTEIAAREVQMLRESDQHENVVRYFWTEQRREFCYIAIELCAASLQDYVKDGVSRDLISALEIVTQSAAGLNHLHGIGIVHRDVKPQNILLSFPAGKDQRVRAIISDFGLSKKISIGRTSLSHNSGISGTDGWIAPEMLTNGRTTQAVDVFALGCVYYYVLTGGHHPFGEPYYRQANIAEGRCSLEASFRERVNRDTWIHLIKAMVERDVQKRPKLEGVLKHPALWPNDRVLHFFQDISDRVEKDDEDTSDIVRALEHDAKDVVGSDWRSNLDPEIAEDLRKFRSYRGHAVRDLLRALRNKKHHYRELTREAREILGEVPNDFAEYWLRKFPGLLLHVWSRVAILKNESVFKGYYEENDFSFELVEPPPLPPREDPVLVADKVEVVEVIQETLVSDAPIIEEELDSLKRNGLLSPSKNVNQRGKNKLRNAKKRQNGKLRSDRENWREKSPERECEG